MMKSWQSWQRVTDMTPQEYARYKLWYKGDLLWLLEPHQIVMLDALNQPGVELFYGDLSRRAGKTFGMVADAISFCIRNPNEKVRYATAFLSDLIEFIQPTFEGPSTPALTRPTRFPTVARLSW